MYGPDFATGKRVDLSKPEETVRQEYERVLVDDYAYWKSELDIEVRIPRGAGHFSDSADLVVYKPGTGRDPASDILGIVELKRPERTDGMAQLKSYLTATSAAWGVWTNGDDIAYVCKPPGEVAVSEDYLNNIPVRGQSLSDVGRLNKSDLRPFGRQELKVAFRRILRTLYANTNISRREKLGSEMVKMIFSKIEDEKTYQDRPPDFRAEAGEHPDSVKRRIDVLFERVREELKYDGVFATSEIITLDAISVAWVVGQLERGSLLRTDTDVVGDAFEVFAESRLVGEKGEFFTPRGVIQLAVKIADPKPEQTVMDPACGSGGFLIQAMKHIWNAMDLDPKWRGSPRLDDAKRTLAARSIYGIDKESDLVKIAKAYMAISGDGRSNIVHENSLHEAKEFNAIAKNNFVESDDTFRKFDFVFTNPPFGTKTRVLRSDAKNFQLGYRWSLDTESGEYRRKGGACERDPYVLFVERCFDMLKDGGVLSIVLPETVFHAPKTGYIRNFIQRSGNIVAVIGLPHNTFRPHCNAKTCLLVIQKGRPQSPNVVMAAPEEMGHDHQGRPLFRPHSDDPWDDLAVVMNELDAPNAESNRFTFLVPWSRIETSGNFIPTFYQGNTVMPMPQGCIGVRLGDLVDAGILGAWDGHGSPPATAKGRGNIPYIRVADIVNWELYRNPVSGIPDEVYQRMVRNKEKPQAEDVIFVRRGSYRIGTVAMASPRDENVLLTRELLTFRVLDKDNARGITAFYLLALLSSEFVQSQIRQKVFVDTTLPNISDRWKALVLPVHTDREEVALISAQAEQVVRKKWEAQEQIVGLSDALGALIT